MHPPHRRRLRLTPTAIAVALAVGACGSAGDDDAQTGADRTTLQQSETATTAPPETTTTAAPTPEEQVLAAYHGYWAAVDEAFGPPQVRPDLPALRQYATGEVLAGIVRQAEEVKGRDSVARLRENGQYVHRAEVLSVDGDTATVRDCNINDVVVETLEREMGWEGVAGCALE